MKVISAKIDKGIAHIGGSLPDIDTDFDSKRRSEVKRYMEQKYGNNYVCSVGTFTTLQVKAAMQDLGRLKGIHNKETSYVTKMIESLSPKYKDVFGFAMYKPKLKQFIQNNSDVISDIELCLGNPKSTSTHACATLIVPKYNKYGKKIDIFDWLPLRRGEKGELISEWEGEFTEETGFLKEDILGTKQLSKFKMIFDLVAATKGDSLSLESIPLDDKGVYNLFQRGLTADNFHFGSKGLSTYSREVKPNCIEDLIAMIALYRPGAMKSNAHNDYVALKHGLKEPTYDYMTESITKETYGVLCYQEQIMHVCQKLGGFTLTEADGIRKAMGKKIKSKMDGYKIKFIEGAVERGCPEQEAQSIWTKLEVFSGYGFNKSHAAAYAITGYISQWLKYNYPTQYWVTALQYADEKILSRFISEINKLDLDIQLKSPDINNSSFKFEADYDQNIIYWALDKVAFIGQSTAQCIIEEREKNGEFFTLEEFLSRVPKSKVKKTGVINLIFSGAFDSLTQHNQGDDVADIRMNLLKRYFDWRGDELPQYISDLNEKQEWWWLFKQKNVCGLGYLDYKRILHEIPDFRPFLTTYIDPDFFYEEAALEKQVCLSGMIQEIRVRKSRNGEFCQIILNNNDQMLDITMWSETYELAKDILQVDCVAIITGKIKYDNYKKNNALYTTQDTELYIL